MFKKHSEVVRDCFDRVTTEINTTSNKNNTILGEVSCITNANIVTTVTTTNTIHILPTKTIYRMLIIPLAFCYLLTAIITLIPASDASRLTQVPAHHPSPPLSPSTRASISLSKKDNDNDLISPHWLLKHAPSHSVASSASIQSQSNSTAAITDIEDDDYYDDGEGGEEGEKAKVDKTNLVSRNRRHFATSPPLPARFGYDGNKIKPQHFYTQQMLVNHINGVDGDDNVIQGDALLSSRTLRSPSASRINNDLSAWNLLDEEKRTDICDVCNCSSTSNSFVTIVCDYNQRNSRIQLSEIFGTNYRIPTTATSITIKLAPNTHFRLEKDLFINNSRMNSFTIVGSYRDGEQVEITTGAFPGDDGTIGPYPEISMQDVFSVVVRESAFSGNKKFTVRNSNDLILYSNAFKRAEINGRFIGVADLRIEEKAFNSANATLHIENSHIDNIYRFEASLREIKFSNCSIGTINSGSFDVNMIYFIAFVNSRIDVIKSRAITEKLFSMHVSFIGGVIGYIEGEAIHGSGINELILRNNSIDTIYENAIHVNAINATISDNRIKHLGQNWLRVKEWSNIVIEKNRFGDFGGIILEETKKPGICRFESNSVTLPKENSLNIRNRHCILREISVQLPCRCNLDWLEKLSERDLRSEIYCTIDTKLGACFNATTFNMLKYENEVCDEAKTTVDCGANRNLKKVDGKFFTLEELENQNTQLIYIIYLSAALIVAIVLMIILILVMRCLCRQKNGSIVGGFSHHHHQQHHRHEFTPNERHIIERAQQLIQKRYPPIHAGVEKLCVELLQSNRTEKQCIKTVTKIENLLSKIERSEDLNAFCSVLAQHLQPQNQSLQHTLEAVYSTGSFEQVQRENYDGPLYAVGCIDTSHTVASMEVARLEHERERERERERDRERERERDREREHVCNAESERNNDTHNVPNEPFYEELGQPLLPDYASPADGRDYASLHDPASGGLNGELEYAEPINNRADYGHGLPPYAPSQFCSTNNKLATQHQQLPSMMLPTAAPRTYLPSIGTINNNNNNNNYQQPLYKTHKTNPAHSSSLSSASSSASHNNFCRNLDFSDNRPELPPSNVRRMAHELQNMPNFHLPNAAQRLPNKHLLTPPVYTAPDISHKRPMPTPSTTFARLATPELDESELDMRGAVALPPDTGSDHSGGSNETVQMDDILYADA